MNPIIQTIGSMNRLANQALDGVRQHPNDEHVDIMADVLDPEELNDLKDNLDRQDIIYIHGIAYELSTYGEPYSDGSRHATLRVWKPF